MNKSYSSFRIMMALKKSSMVVVFSTITLLMTLFGITGNAAILASAQDSGTTEISIVSDASRLTNTAYQPNPINIRVGDTVEWINDDSAPHTVTERNRSDSSSSDGSDDDKPDSGIFEKIIDEIVTNIEVNIRNNLGGGGDDDNNSIIGDSPSSAEFDSGLMQTGERFSYTFNNPGTFEYYCAVHPSMVAEIDVS
jgi:plastocyanin